MGVKLIELVIIIKIISISICSFTIAVTTTAIF